MAAMLAAFARLVREKPVGAMNVILACTVDEEHTSLGVQRLVREGLRADMAVVAEPTQLQIINAHKGVVRWHLETRGRAWHSSAPEKGVNAIYRMAHVLSAVEQFAERLRTSRADSLLGPPTLSVGRIEGGTSANTIPDRCRVEIDRRLIPGEDPLGAPEQLAMWLKKALPAELDFTCTEPWLQAPALSSADSTELVTLLGRAIDRVLGSHEVRAVPYCTDAATVALSGIPAVVFGPGDIATAHTCDESVRLDQVEQASEILYRLACAA
jgi:acetylornithine deacetylase/succinyl-diaminopimelate desuccinylase-like protein